MISKAQKVIEQGRLFSGRTFPSNILHWLSAFAIFLWPFKAWSLVSDEPFTIIKPAEIPAGCGRYEGFTFKRVKKVGNFFAYGWVKHDRRKHEIV